ncbi:MAG: hypothetical protein ACJA2Q_002213 [Pseudohongiellaceae bacterium]|jgi:hypothetical protein
MTELKFCKSHPLAGAIESCRDCSAQLCGMCANFDRTGVFCEGCLAVHENQQFVSAQAAQATRAAATALQSDAEEFVYNPPTGKKFNTRSVQLTIIFICTLATAAQLYFYNQPSSAPRDPLTLQREQAITSLVECLTVFGEIGLVLGKGEKPGTAMRCNDSFEPNRLIDNGDEIRVIHPNPQNYGYKTIYVSNKSPVPVAELLE